MADLIRLEKINKEYGIRVKTKVLYDIDLTFAEQSFNAIIGQSGSGKSTLMNIIGTLDQPTSGDIWIDQVRTTDMNADQLAALRNQSIGFIFQFHYLLPEFTVMENVLMPWRIRGLPVTKDVRDRAADLLDTVGLNKVHKNLATALSGGQQQRTAIARALINQPKIILADEPTGNLDSAATDTVYALLRQINKKMKTTFIIITHDKRVAEQADRIIEIKDGRIEMDVQNKI